MKRYIGVMALAALSGCVSLGGGKAPGQLVRLSAESGAPAGAGSGPALLVSEPETDRALAVSRVAVMTGPTGIAYMPGVAWVSPPARLFRGLLAETLRARGGHLVLEDDQPEAASGALPHTRLSGRLAAFGYDAPSRSVVVRYDALVQGPDGALAARRFEAVEPVASARPAVVVPALNHAANVVAGDVADWTK